MPVIPPARQQEIEAALARGDVAWALAAIASYPDLKNADLPPLSPGTLKRLGEDAAALRELALGLASPSASVRRLASKLLRKLPGAFETVLALAVETLEPLRPAGAGALLGSWAGVASPVGEVIVEKGLGRTVRPPAAYPEAVKYGKAVLEEAIAVLVALRPAAMFLLHELADARLREEMRRAASGPGTPPGGSDVRLHSFAVWAFDAHAGKEVAKGHEELAAVVEGWLRGALLADAGLPGSAVAAAVRERFGTVAEQARDETRLSLAALAATRLFLFLPREQRIRLFPALSASTAAQAGLRRYREAFPAELPGAEKAAAEREARRIEENRPFVDSLSGEAAPGEPVAPQETAFTEKVYRLGPDSGGPRVFDVLAELSSLADRLGLPRLAARLHEDLGRRGEPALPAQSTAATAGADEELLGQLRELALAAGRRGEAHLADGAPAWQALGEPLLELLVRAAEPRLARLAAWTSGRAVPDPSTYETWQQFHLALAAPLCAWLRAACALLPRDVLPRWADHWARRAVAHGYTTHGAGETLGGLLDLLVARPLLPALVVPILEAETHRAVRTTLLWQVLAARLYATGDPACREAVRAVVARVPPPSFPRGRDPRKDWSEHHQWLLLAAFRGGDVELLASALERLAFPYVVEKGRAVLPVVESPVDRADRTSAWLPSTRASASGVPLDEVWALVAGGAPARVPAILERHLEAMERDDFPELLLGTVARGPGGAALLAPFAAQLLELLESAEKRVVQLGLDLAIAVPEVVADDLGPLEKHLARVLASTSPGHARSAAALLGTLARSFPSERERLLPLLEEALAHGTATVVEEALRSLGKAAPLPASLAPRVRALAGEDPKRYGKLAAALLGAGA